jgi:predicted nucleic acid-binding protein
VYLVDTDVISAAAPTKRPHPTAIDWLRRNSENLFLSAVTVTEIEDGIAQARRRQAVQKATMLTAWLNGLLHLYAARIIVFDVPIARLAGGLSDIARGLGHAPGLADIVIAATAKHRGFTVLTRNLRHFKPLGVPAADPFTKMPDDR